MLCIFEHGIGIIPVNEKALLSTQSGQSIHMYGAGVLQNQISVISPDFGSIWQESIIRTPRGVYGCEFGAVSGFSLNGNAPIAAKKGFSFVLNDDKISLEPVLGVSASLPKSLKNLSISTDALPNYVLEAV